ncbi:unnamed protein product, partial [Prorocentrum cordatum]
FFASCMSGDVFFLCRSGLALAHASVALRADPAVVAAAVASDGEALEFAAVQLRACPEIVLAAVRRSPGALRFAAPELRFSPGWASLLSAPGLCGDRAVALAAVAQDRRRRRRQSCA